MINFIAFNFCDNDFNAPLNDTLSNYIQNHQNIGSHVSAEWWKEYAIRGMLGFDSLRSIERLPVKPYDYADCRKYFDNTLNVSLIRKMNFLKAFKDT